MQSHRYLFPRVATIFAILLLIGLCRVAEAQANPTLLESIAKANVLTDLSAAVPYELHAQIIIEPGSEHAQRGQLTIYRDQARSRIELQLGDFHQVEVVNEGTRYVSRSRPYPLVGLDVLNNVEDAVHLRYWFPAGTKFSKNYSRKVGGVAASCFDAKQRYAGKSRFCFDSSTGAVLEASDYTGWRGSFSGYAAAGERSFPTKMELTQTGKPRHVEFSEIQVASKKFDNASFAVPEGARAFSVCNGVAAARATVDSDWTVSSNEMGKVYVYAVVEADGSADLVIFGGSKRLRREVSKAARKWNFYAAHCGATTIASEAVFPLVRVVPGLDSSGTDNTIPRPSWYQDSSPFDRSCCLSTDINTYWNTGGDK